MMLEPRQDHQSHRSRNPSGHHHHSMSDGIWACTVEAHMCMHRRKHAHCTMTVVFYWSIYQNFVNWRTLWHQSSLFLDIVNWPVLAAEHCCRRGYTCPGPRMESWPLAVFECPDPFQSLPIQTQSQIFHSRSPECPGYSEAGTQATRNLLQKI